MLVDMIGSRLGKWVIDRELGRGGMGRVYLAHEESSGQLAAVKLLAAELAQEAGFLQRFQREIEVLGQLTHPNIVRFYESGSQDGNHYFAMEYVEGQSFEQILYHQGRVPWPEVLDAALQICPALKHAHDRGIIHRDLKPPNLLRTPAGVIKLTDFGIAKVFAAQQLTSTGGVVGTAEYLSPEQAAGKIATKRSDLYCLGVVLYTLLTGRTPFEGRTAADLLHKHLYAQFDRPRNLVPELPHDLDDIVCQLLEKDPARRPPDSLVLHRQLDQLRRKLERKSQRTVLLPSSQPTVAEHGESEFPVDSPGPATLMSQLMRQELEQQKQGNVLNRWLNRPWVLLPLFLLCVGIIAWRLWPGPEHSSANEGEVNTQQIDDQDALARALRGLPKDVAVSDAQQFYQRGLRLCREGDGDAARQVWENVVRTFRDVGSEDRWVQLSKQGLQELAKRSPPRPHPDKAVQEALQKARQWREQGQRDKAEEIWKGLEALYRGDPTEAGLLQQVERDRRQ